MAGSIVSTTNADRIWGALAELEEGLSDPERMRIGAVFGDPGRGKTCTAEKYHAERSDQGEIDTYWVEAKPTWRLPSMLRDMLIATGIDSQKRSANDLLTELTERLTKRPGVFIIDESHRFLTHSDMAEAIKYLHDATPSAFMLVGEARTRHIIARYLSFESRLNDLALVEVQRHSFADVGNVVRDRCRFAVSDDVCREIHRSCADSMRLVVRECRKMHAFVATNGLESMDLDAFQAMSCTDRRQRAKKAVPVTTQLAVAAGGSHG